MPSSLYIKQGTRISVSAAGAIDVREQLPAMNYMVQLDPRTEEFYLEEIAPFALPTKYYGDIEKTANRIISTYHDRSMSTGVMLSGEKGSGKTLLAKRISHLLLSEQIATIVINECYYGDKFNNFIQAIDQPCVIIFDEFEKVYNKEKQEHVLTLLDGTFSTKKLFILTTNNSSRVDQHMQNRPGRIFYSINYTGLEVEFIQDYCEDTLLNKSYIEEICRLSALFAAFNFDILKALVEEMNRYDESPKEALKMLNATPEDYNTNKFTASITVDGVGYHQDRIYNKGVWSGNPLSPAGIQIEYRNPQSSDDDDEPYWKTLSMKSTNLVSVDVESGTFVFKDTEDNSITLKRSIRPIYHYDAF